MPEPLPDRPSNLGATRGPRHARTGEAARGKPAPWTSANENRTTVAPVLPTRLRCGGVESFLAGPIELEPLMRGAREVPGFQP
jgi:hypothetical protein